MNVFERYIVGEVPLDEAAGFFVKLKYAGWADPPDETGELEGPMASPPDQVAAKSAEVAAVKFKLMVAYHVYGESMKNLAQHAVGEMFREHAEQERAAAEFYLKRASVLNDGPVQLDHIESPPAASDPEQILSTMIRAEQEGIAGQRELRAMVGEEHPMRFEVERILTEDLHHLDELRQLSGQAQQAMPEPQAKPEPSQSIKIETSAPQAQEPEAEVAEEPVAQPAQEQAAPPVDPNKLAASNAWVAKRVIGGLDSRAAKAGIKPSGHSGDRVKKLTHAMGGKGSDHAAQREAVTHIKERVPAAMAKLDRSTGHKQPHPPAKKSSLVKHVVGATAGTAAAMAMLGAHKKHKEKTADAKSFARGATVGFGAGAGGTAVALDQAHKWADKRRAESKQKSASEMLDAMLANNEMLEGKHGHFKTASMRMKLAGAKLAAPLGTDMPTDQDGQTTPVAAPTPVDNAPAEPPQPEPIPGDYVQNELAALSAQNANEAAFYRGQVESSQQQTEQLQQQIQQMQEQLGQIQNQSAVAGVQVQALTNQATSANDRALQYSSETANMRMGVQKMREALMQLASQDPAAMGTLAEMDQQQQAQEQAAGVGPDGQPLQPQEPGAQPGTPENSPAPGGGTPPGAAGAGAEGTTDSQPEAKAKDPDDSSKTQISIKNASSALPWMAGGGMLGALDGVLGERKKMKDLPGLHQKVQDLEAGGEEGNTFEQAVALARAKADLEEAKITNKFPDRAMTRAALKSGKTGMMLGSSLHGGLNDLKDAWHDFNR